MIACFVRLKETIVDINELRETISKNSSYIANALQHIWLSDLMRCLWKKDPRLKLNIFTAEVDDSGQDILLSLNNVVARHVQLKSSHLGAKTKSVQVNTGLSGVESGCVVWMFYDPEEFTIQKYLFLGAIPGEPLPSLSGFKTARRTTPTRSGNKPERPRIRKVPRSAFRLIQTTEELLKELFDI